MALISYIDKQGNQQTYRVPWKSTGDLFRINIGSASAPKNDLHLPGDLGILPQHAILTRARAPVAFVLLDLSNGQTWVNEAPVFKLKALSHLDKFRLGEAEFIFHEIHVETIGDNSPYLNKPCALYGTQDHKLEKGDKIVVCRCGAAMHRACWFQLDQCSTPGCWFPIKALIIKQLSGRVKFHQVEEDSELTRKLCSARQPRDTIPFHVREDILRCPQCASWFHIGCWLLQEKCPCCDYPVRELTEDIFRISDDQNVSFHDKKASE